MGGGWDHVPVHRDKGEGVRGVKFFKASLPYKIEDGVTKFIFFTDKDSLINERRVTHSIFRL